MAEFALMIAEEYSRQRDLQKPKFEKDNASSQSESQMAALMRRFKDGVSEYIEASTVKVAWEQPADTTAERFGTYKEKSLQIHSELQRPVIAKKIRKEVEAFTEHARFTKEQIATASEKHATEQGEVSNVPTDTPTTTPTGKTRATKAKAAKKKMEEDKLAESQRDVFDVDVQMFKQHEQQEEQVEKKTEGKSSNEPPMNMQPNDTKTPSVSANVNIDDNQKENTDENTDEEVPMNEQNVETKPPPIKDTTEEDKTEKEKTEKEKA
ncbi:uncharacterized protein LOC131859307 [Cryptomeria japonica]|uniref:uncharacterized protein LOC131859307 n=1 Tax=Cryptomeria japonica TaxID=3369 RepID=UPI0027DA1277|nr:uncharacterized protein LOC131859307 [Cryptomeria japonica]